MFQGAILKTSGRPSDLPLGSVPVLLAQDFADLLGQLRGLTRDSFHLRDHFAGAVMEPLEFFRATVGPVSDADHPHCSRRLLDPATVPWLKTGFFPRAR
jgi:hypothetical protein